MKRTNKSANGVKNSNTSANENRVNRGKSSKLTIEDKVTNAVLLEDDLRLQDLKSKIGAFFAPVEWSGAAAVRAALAAVPNMTQEMIDGAVAAAARRSGVDLSGRFCSVARVLAVIRRNFVADFERLCGVSFNTLLSYYRNNSVGRFGCSWSLSLPLSLVTADSDINEFVTAVSLSSSATPSQIISGVLSFRWLAAFRRAVVGSKLSARNEVKTDLANVIRKARRLGLSSEWCFNVINSLWAAVPANDEAERRRIARNLGTQQKRLNNINYRLMVACPAVCEVDTSGDFFVPAAAALPANHNRASGRLFAARQTVLSNISTLSSLLTLGC